MSQNMEHINDIRIGLYLSGEMKGTEREQFEQELASDTTLHAAYTAAKRIWDFTPQEEATAWNTDVAWARFAHQAPVVQRKALTIRRTLYWAVAATFAITAGIYSFFFAGQSPVTYAYEAGMTNPIELTDGSKVYLNKDAEVKVYPFTARKRHIALSGEAFLEVEPDAGRPFTVASSGTLTEVVGTAFSISQMGNKTRIFVHSGKVIFSSEDNSQTAVALTKGEAAIYGNRKIELIPNPSPNIISWKTQELHFAKQMPLKDIIADIAEYFDAKVIVENEEAKACRITLPSTVQNPEIKSLLKIVATAISADLVEENDAYIIRGGKSCL
jgi:transmembrane sensor